jgi:hypothetical protein
MSGDRIVGQSGGRSFRCTDTGEVLRSRETKEMNAVSRNWVMRQKNFEVCGVIREMISAECVLRQWMVGSRILGVGKRILESGGTYRASAGDGVQRRQRAVLVHE